MKKFNSLALAAILSTTGAAAFAEQSDVQRNPVGPVAMTDAQLDNVAAGLVNVGIAVVDVVDVNNVANRNQVQVGIPVNAAAAIGILGTAGAVATQPGNITQGRGR